MTKPTQDKETLREAVARAMYESRDNYIPWGHITQKWRRFWYEQADAAIAAMFERLRTPSEGMIEAGESVFDAAAYADLVGPTEVWQAMLTAFQQENSECPSCGGLNTSCPDGCGRDPITGELNFSRLENSDA